MGQKILLILMAVGLFAGCSQLPLSRNSQGALQVTSNSEFAVFLDDNHLGQTPFFDERIKTGEYVLKLVPEATTGNEAWQAKVNISRRALTVVNYDHATNPDEASSEILQLEPLGDRNAVVLTLSTLPDNVIVKLDNEIKGFSPISFDDITAGDHALTLEAPGYITKTINVKTTSGHHLIVQAHMARDVHLEKENQQTPQEEASPSSVLDEEILEPSPSPSGSPRPSPSASPSPTTSKATPGPGDVVNGIILGETSAANLEKPVVKILEASPGIDWLRVRAEPQGLVSNEVARVKVNTYFALVGTSDNSEWYEIEYQSRKTGWIAAKFAQVTE